jgi:hypothetical protein
MAVIKSGATADLLTIDPVSKAARVTIYDSAGREISSQSKATYAAANTLTPVATATDIIQITGSASKTVRVIAIYLATTATAAGSLQVQVIKRSTADTGGTFVPAALVPFDSNDAAATANVGHYITTNPTLGTGVGNVNIQRLASTVPVGTTFAGVAEDAGKELLPWFSNSILDKPVVLRGIAQTLCVNLNGAALLAGQTHAYRIVWTEE